MTVPWWTLLILPGVIAIGLLAQGVWEWRQRRGWRNS